jgi:hypothetical protein
MHKRLVHICQLFIAHPQSAKLIQTREGPLHPPPSAQTAAVFGISLCKKRDDAAVTQALPNCFGIIPPVTHDTLGR